MVIRVPEPSTVLGGYAALDDRVLVLDFQAGNPEAFVEIHDRYGTLAHQVCRRFLPNAQDAEEAFQETMIRVFRGLYRFNGRYALGPWIARIAKNVSLDMIRTQSRRPQIAQVPASEELPKPGDEADEIVERLVQRDLVLAVLRDLPETHRQALMLRELEGRSHREIAQAMEMSPSQAKALIHRAKGSFRRHWLEKVAERGGLVAIAFLPLLWLVRFGHGVRRIVDRVAGSATQVAQAAPEAVAQTAAATSASAPAATGMAERLVAAGMTILVAGGVTVGAARLVGDRGGADRVEEVAAAVVPSETVEDAPVVVEAPGSPAQDAGPSGREGPRVLPGEIEPTPGEEPSPTPSEEPAPGQEPSPSEGPSPSQGPSPTQEPPVIPPAPGWSGSVAIAWSTDEQCGCGGGVSGGSQSTSGEVGDRTTLTVRQGFAGAATDAEGDAAWAMTGEYLANLNEGNGSLELVVRLADASGSHSYTGQIGSAVVNGTPGSGQPIVYTFTGSYSLAYGAVEDSPIPTQGALYVQLAVWADGSTVYDLQILLSP